MFDRESRPKLWRVGQRFYIARTHTPIIEGLGLELALESADSSSESADSNADPPKIGVWVRAFTELLFTIASENSFSPNWQIIVKTIIIKVRTHWADFLSADSKSRPFHVVRFQRVQNIKDV